MIERTLFNGLKLRGGFTIVRVESTNEALVDALGREAIARTRIIGREFHVAVRPGLPQQELSVTIYHEILEAAAVASLDPPAAVLQLNEADFERAAYRADKDFGPASPESLNRLLQSFGFREQ